MKKSKEFIIKKKYTVSVVFAVAFCGLIALVRAYNVAPIGPLGTEIGFYGLNGTVRDAISVNETWYEITEILGYLSIAVAGFFVILGAVQMLKRKSLFKVDKKFYALAGLYAAMAFIYALFEVVVVNYRPVIMEGAEHVEASFPSSHTMLVCVIMGGAFVIIGAYIKNRGLALALKGLAVAVATVTVVGRLLSGVHWFTDILGGVFISFALVILFSAVCDKIDMKKE